MIAEVESETKSPAVQGAAVNKNPLITFYKAYPDSLPAMSADRSALGTIPAQAYQYCEALTTASAFGWYAFPATSVTLYFDGVDTYRLHDGEKTKVVVEQLSGMDQWWNQHCPAHLHDMAPPFLTSLGIPGYIQVWSGLLVQSRRNWSSLIRPIANYAASNQFFCFEGIVETDRYAPAPLFINLKLQVTHTPIELSYSQPLFQIQPIHRDCYSKKNLLQASHQDINQRLAAGGGMSDANWQGYSNTVRKINPADDMHKTGQYATKTRKRAKAGNV